MDEKIFSGSCHSFLSGSSARNLRLFMILVLLPVPYQSDRPDLYKKICRNEWREAGLPHFLQANP
jgi:hypothetical protein